MPRKRSVLPPIPQNQVFFAFFARDRFPNLLAGHRRWRWTYFSPLSAMASSFELRVYRVCWFACSDNFRSNIIISFYYTDSVRSLHTGSLWVPIRGSGRCLQLISFYLEDDRTVDFCPSPLSSHCFKVAPSPNTYPPNIVCISSQRRLCPFAERVITTTIRSKLLWHLKLIITSWHWTLTIRFHKGFPKWGGGLHSFDDISVSAV